MKGSALERLMASLRRFPGVGPKQAQRLAMYLLRAPAQDVKALSSAIQETREKVRPCRVCFDFCEGGICQVCSDPGRDQAAICVVEDPADVAAIERTRSFRGRYHVLHGALSPLDGVGPEAIRVKELVRRVADSAGGVAEVIVATDPDAEGDATALYLGQVLRPLGVRVTRIAMGVPMGGDLDYADERTLLSSLVGRREL